MGASFDSATQERFKAKINAFRNPVCPAYTSAQLIEAEKKRLGEDFGLNGPSIPKKLIAYVNTLESAGAEVCLKCAEVQLAQLREKKEAPLSPNAVTHQQRKISDLFAAAKKRTTVNMMKILDAGIEAHRHGSKYYLEKVRQITSRKIAEREGYLNFAVTTIRLHIGSALHLVPQRYGEPKKGRQEVTNKFLQIRRFLEETLEKFAPDKKDELMGPVSQQPDKFTCGQKAFPGPTA